MHEIKGIEIFKTGKWNGDNYDEKDLDSMVSAFDQVGFRPPVKLGHENLPGEPAHGWVEKIWRKGQVLMADLKDVPSEIFQQIKDRAYDHVSAEIFWNLARGGQTFSRALKAIALLGSECPAVSGLAPLRTAVNGLSTEYHRHVMPWEDPDDGEEPDYDFLERKEQQRMSTQEDPGAILAHRANRYCIEHPGVKMLDAIKILTHLDKSNADLVRQYGNQTMPACGQVRDREQLREFKAKIGNGGLATCAGCSTQADCKAAGICSIGQRERRSSPRNPSYEIDAKVRQHMADSGEKSYRVALAAVRRQHPTLAAAYHQWQFGKAG